MNKKTLTTIVVLCVGIFGLVGCQEISPTAPPSAPVIQEEATSSGVIINEAEEGKNEKDPGIIIVNPYNNDINKQDQDRATYFYVFKDGSNWVLIEAKMTEELKNKLESTSFKDVKNPEDIYGLMEQAELVSYEVIATEPSQAELKKYVNKTGQNLVSEGFVIDSLSINGKDTVCMATKSPFTYKITFTGAVKNVKSSTPEKEITKLKIKSFEITGIDEGFIKQ